MKAVKYILYVFLVVLLLLEVLLRFYDPFAFRQRSDRVILPRNRKMIFTNESVPGLDTHITHTKNSLGFRGPEPPVNWNDYTTVIAVGGSTTECFYLSDSLCWTSLLQQRLGNRYWVNNAGYQGHSTYGNFILVNDYVKQMKPNYILLLEGINEIDRTDLLPDESISGDAAKTTAWGWLKRNSRIVDLVLNLHRHFLADRLNVSDNYFDVSSAQKENLSNEQIQAKVHAQVPLANAYAQRLTKIIDTCVSNGITPVLITQPMLFGMANDCKTGVDLSQVKITDGYNGEVMWRMLELFNDRTRAIAADKKLLCIDLAVEMPKCSTYFYDICHFTNKGSAVVSSIIADHLSSYLTNLSTERRTKNSPGL